MAPREGHFKAMCRVFGCLKMRPKGKIVVDVSHPGIRKEIVVDKGHD